MKKQYFLVIILLSIALLTACSAQPNPAIETDVPASSFEVQVDDASATETAPPFETSSPNCLGDEVSPVGQSIADDYEIASYEQVMTWFCNGAEFEDILVALETQSQTDVPADEMLQMLVDGFTWEEIWQVIGLVN